MKTFYNIKGEKINEGEMPKEEVVQTAVTVTIPKALGDDLVKTIDERLGDEYAAHFFYRSAANWCKNANYKKAAAFFEAESVSELEHAKGLQDYLTQWNIIPSIPASPTHVDFIGLVDIINKAYALEYSLYEKYCAFQQSLNGNPATFNFIQGYVDIQNQSIAEYSDLLNALQLIDVNVKLDLLFFENTYF
jgi:ferritin